MEGEKSTRSMNWSKSFEQLFGSPNSERLTIGAEEDEEALKWAALERLPTYSRLRTSIMKSYIENENKVVHKEVDVRKLEISEKQELIDKLFKVPEEDNEKFLKKFRQRVDKYVRKTFV